MLNTHNAFYQEASIQTKQNTDRKQRWSSQPWGHGEFSSVL